MRARLRQRNHRIGIEGLRPWFRELLDHCLALGGIGKPRSELSFDSVALERRDSQLRHEADHLGVAVMMPAVPSGSLGKSRSQIGHHSIAISCVRRRDDRDDSVHRIGKRDAPLKCLVAAERQARDRDEMLHAERVKQSALRGNDVDQAVVGEIGTVAHPGFRIHARGRSGTVRRAEHVRRHDEIFVGVDRLAGSYQPVPPSGLAIRVESGRVLTRGVAMGNQDRIAPVRREVSIGLVRQDKFGQDLAAFKTKVPGRETLYVNYAETFLICHGTNSFDVFTACSRFTKAFDSLERLAYKIVSNRSPEKGSHYYGYSRVVAVHEFSLQREGALGVGLQACTEYLPFAYSGVSRSNRQANDGQDSRSRAEAERHRDYRLEQDHRGARGRVSGPSALSRRLSRASASARTGRLLRRGAGAIYSALDFSRHPAVPEVCARCLRVARERGCSTSAARDVSADRRDHAAANGYQSRDRRDRARQDD